jgi:antirestriction protein ArdC
MTDRKELYATVTAHVVRQIEEGAGEWRMPWQAIAETGQPVNATTHQAYRGGNHLWFALVAQSRGWGSHWATYKQWRSVGAQVRKGERATHGVHWSTIVKKDDSGEPIGDARLVPHAFAVFNACQVDGWEAPPEAPRDTPERLAGADQFLTAVGATIRHEGNQAFYAPGADFIQLPELEQFSSVVDYATSAHEHAHWTGHTGRLARDLSGRFESDAYAAEELVAELSAAFTCAHLGISTTPRRDHAAYLASWLRVLQADPSALFTVASKAQAATDYLVGRASALLEPAPGSLVGVAA